jgi:glyoxylase-like metal-dependent hydrolase (beta-lactamase superfamily II)
MLPAEVGNSSEGRTAADNAQALWKKIYKWPELPADGSQWDRQFSDRDTFNFKVGNVDVSVMFSPGHTLASITYVIGDAAFVHDTLFMLDGGTARCDLQALEPACHRT